MALPSQTGRPAARRNYMYRRARRRRGPRRLFILATILIIAVIVVWQFWPDGGAASGPRADAEADSGQSTSDPEDPFNALEDLDSASQGRLASETRRFPAAPPRETGSSDSQPEREPAGGPNEIRMGRPLPDKTLADRSDEDDGDREAEASSPERTPSAMTSAPSRPDPEPSREAEQTGSSSRAVQVLRNGIELMKAYEFVKARRYLTVVLDSGQLAPDEADNAREALRIINERLVFSPEIDPDDSFVFDYTIEKNDVLSRLPRKLGVLTNWRFVQRINNIKKPEHIRVGQRIKLITGPFHCVVDKSDYRLDLYLGEGPDRVFVRSFDVGLGEYNSTPVGLFRVKDGSKLINPQWANPRTGELFKPNDPDNPIGEYWLGLEGAEERVADVTGYGIHGTIEPESIGKQSSMGCIRMLNDDVAVIWEVLTERVSTVEIRP